MPRAPASVRSLAVSPANSNGLDPVDCRALLEPSSEETRYLLRIGAAALEQGRDRSATGLSAIPVPLLFLPLPDQRTKVLLKGIQTLDYCTCKEERTCPCYGRTYWHLQWLLQF